VILLLIGLCKHSRGALKAALQGAGMIFKMNISGGNVLGALGSTILLFLFYYSY
jgi:hypothetical protein